MRFFISLTALLFVVFAAPVQVSAFKNSKDSVGTIRVGETKRSYTIHVPRGLKGEVPLVLVLHGFLSGRAYVAWDTAMSKYADRNGFIAVYPKGLGLSWNAGDCCGKSAEIQADDVAFIRSLVEDMRTNYKINDRMIFACGFSNGAMMCYRLAQELPDVFAAVASVEGSLRSITKLTNGPISVLIIHGDRDRVFPYDGGIGHWLRYKVRTAAIEDTVKYWVVSNECNSVPLLEKYEAFEKQTYSQGKEGTEVVLYKVKSNGHFWPGGRESKLFHKQMGSKMVASQKICEFFLQHPKTLLVKQIAPVTELLH